MRVFIFFLSIVASSSAISFDCIFSYSDWSYLGTSYTCTTTSCDFGESQSLTNITGDHLDDRTYDDVKVFFIQSCQSLSFIPQGIQHFFPNFIGLQLQYISLNHLTGDELREYENLQWMVIAYQNIPHMPGNFFSNNPKMQDFYFVFNQMSSVGEDFPDSLENFNSARFNGNVCINMAATEPSGIPALQNALRENCIVNEGTTAPSMTTTIGTTTQEPTCDVNETICELKAQNKILMEKVDLILELLKQSP